MRYHHLDALRAFAMLLGIVIHASLSFVEIPVWPAQDLYQNTIVYSFIKDFIHGFRMPLFFLLSGFFTAMMWRKRGGRALVRHRSIRILLPLVVGTLLVWPPIIGLGIWGHFNKEKVSALRLTTDLEDEGTLWKAVRDGDQERLKRLLSDGRPNARDVLGASPLEYAAIFDRSVCVDLLVESGARVVDPNRDGNTALHVAAFFGRTAVARNLIDRGADVNAENDRNETPLVLAQTSESLVTLIAGILQIEISLEEVAKGRLEVLELLQENGARTEMTEMSVGKSIWQGLVRAFLVGSLIPVFHHLWFLYYLLWFVGAFLLFAIFKRRFFPGPLPGWLVEPPGCWFWALPLCWFSQVFMVQAFGPDTAPGILPWPPKLLYYAVFFAVGALAFGRTWFDSAGNRWPVWLFAALPFLFGGLAAFSRRGEGALFVPLGSLCAVVFAWLMSFAFLGLFRAVFSKNRPWVRYLSDSSYWLYLAHVPLVLLLQIVVSTWPLPSFIKLVSICIVTVGSLLVVYEYGVRYTWIGTILNGKKVRTRSIETV